MFGVMTGKRTELREFGFEPHKGEVLMSCKLLLLLQRIANYR